MEPEQTEIVTRTATIRVGDHGIVWVVLFPGAEQTLEDARMNVAAVANVLNNRPGMVLVDMRSVKSIDREARVYYSGPESTKVMLGLAMIVTAPISRLVGNFLIFTFRDTRVLAPIKMFSNEKDAIDWLLSLDSSKSR